MGSTGDGQPAGLKWTIDEQHNLRTIRVEGELDLSSAPALQSALDGSIDGRGVVVLDLAALEFMDSTGLRLLAQVHQRARAAGARFLLARPSTAALRVLQVAGLTDHFDYVEGAPPRDRVCPVCDEWVAITGVKCPHCGSSI